MRRGLSEKMLSAVDRFPDTGSFTRQVTFLPSFEPNVGYVLLQLRVPEEFRATADFREKRQTLLQIACGAAKNKFPNLVKVHSPTGPRLSLLVRLHFFQNAAQSRLS